MNQDKPCERSGAVRVRFVSMNPASAIRLRGPCALGLDVWDTPLSRAPAAAVIAAYCALCTTVSLIPLPGYSRALSEHRGARRRVGVAGVGRAAVGVDSGRTATTARLPHAWSCRAVADCTVTVGGDPIPNFLSRDRSGSDAPRFFTCISICSSKHHAPGRRVHLLYKPRPVRACAIEPVACGLHGEAGGSCA